MRFTFNHPGLNDLPLEERCAIRRQYRAWRIAMYANIEYTGWDRPAYQGCYGMEREQTRDRLYRYYSDLNWAYYLGSK